MTTLTNAAETLRGIDDRFCVDAMSAGLRVEENDARRVFASLLSKRFLIATGLSGSGKTKLVHAIANWLSPNSLQQDPFVAGATIEANRISYHVKRSDKLSVEFGNDSRDDANLVTLPRDMITQWADYIEENQISREQSARSIREAVKQTSKYSDQLHSFETHLKAAAFALLASKKSAEFKKCYEIIPVGADWTNNESVLGYASGLDPKTYYAKPALSLVLQAIAHPDAPHFLILDEMNLSHVERYFADILSAIESGEAIPLHEGQDRWSGANNIPGRLVLPRNLFVIGTVNVDETTYMFSPKVLDRANVIEFRMRSAEIKSFLQNPAKPDLEKLCGLGGKFANTFAIAARTNVEVPAEIKSEFEIELGLLFDALQYHGAEFGYRVAHEAARFVYFYNSLGGTSGAASTSLREAFDGIIVQKVLPKLHGSRAKLAPILKSLWYICTHEPSKRGHDALTSAINASRSNNITDEPSSAPEHLNSAHYSLSAEKITRMWRLLNENGFASFAEA
jgi:hypothetical protein